ncbi:amino acid adenylation domain-containing protein [Micromonospora matsumotoense]|uniref:non-ribosomal peptide synthetase n=1 Tax=Micromonospora matsumotoense TaxID=121616 RepID=UPI003419E975
MSRDIASRKEEALWLLEKVVQGSAVNNLSVAFRVDGRLDPEALRQSLTLLMRRYPVLRTVFHAGDDGLTKTVTNRDTIALEAAECTDERADEALAAFVARPFALSGASLVRALLLHGHTKDHLCLAVHHLVFDTISGAVLLEELTAAYTAFATGTPPPAGLREEVAPLPMPETRHTPAGTAFWRGQLSGFDPERLALWMGEPDVANPTLRGDQVLHRLSAGARDAVQRMAKVLRASEAVVLLAAYYLLLARHGAGPDIVVGSPVNVRGPRAQRALGYHVNVLPLRVAVNLEGSFVDLVHLVRKVFMGALAHADLSVDVLLEEVPRRDVSWHNALFRHVFNYVPGEGLPPFELAGLTAEPVVVENGFSKFDLEFFVLSSPESIGLRAAYCVEAFARADVAALLGRYDRLLQTLGQDIAMPVGEADLFSTNDREIVDRANGTDRAVPLTSVLDGIRSRALTDPDATALEFEDRRVSYGQLWQAARETAAELRASGVAAGVVAVLGPRSPELAAAVLGVWLCGAAYLPLDPNHPADRLRHQLDDARTAVVLAADPATVPDADSRAVRSFRPVPNGSAGAEAAGGEGEQVPHDAGTLDPDSCAYLIYTSGSTGLPKGTLISHRNLANLVTHFADQFDVMSTVSLLWLTTFSFDISALELFVPLARGGRVVVAPDRARTDGRTLAEAVVRHRVDIVQATPTTWRLVIDDAADVLSSCRVLCGGEPLPRGLARRLASVAREVWNVYGPTETTIWSTTGRIDPAEAGPPTVGTPIANTRVFIADPAGRELPVSVLGELCVAGDGVALGYHNRPELTAARFAHHPRYGRHYRTGDLARWRPDGTLHVVGRTDRQVKLRGNRIELSEVEAVLLADPDVRGVAAVVVGEAGEDDMLVAFVEGPDKHELAERLWDRARAKLPHAAVPSAFHFVEAFPMTGNDKVHYPALTRLAEERRAERRTAEDTHEQDHVDHLLSTLVSLWRELLDRDDLDHRANFFTVGGHSLLAARLAQRIEEVTGTRVPMADIFAQPTPQRLAEHLRTAGLYTTGACSEAPDERGGRC